MKFLSVLLLLTHSLIISFAQDYRWQQRVEYSMDVSLNVNTHQMKGSQHLTYYNNSPDTLLKVYYHLYFNAFQPGSMMDVRSRNLPDPDPRVMDRISKLRKDEIGYQHISSLKQDGKNLKFSINGTVLEVLLATPLLPQSKTIFEMQFEAQVPLQIRRSGRDNKEQIDFTMTQWYPKMAEYDFKGWHPYQYVAREFHGVWGDFNVKITLDARYTVAGTGILQNPNEVGHGYENKDEVMVPKKPTITWNFIAKNVHDFAWAADPDYSHTRVQVPDGPELHFFYQPGSRTTENWTALLDYGIKHFQFMNQNFGKYPYPIYSVIQGGDGAMEYPMCTMLNGERSLPSLVGSMAHEASHSWYQGVLGNNESLYPWMDEGFTDFSSSESFAAMFNQKDAHKGSYQSYFKLIDAGLQEPLSQHADHYNTNTGYNTAAYSMGAIFLNQLKYLVGEEVFYKGMKRYFNTWKFKHPEPNDFLRVMEKESGLQLHWYYRYWILTTKHIDYGIESAEEEEGGTLITLKRKDTFPMPIELLVTYKNGSKEMFYISMNELLGNKLQEDASIKWTVLDPWNWVNPEYSFVVTSAVNDIERIEIDPSQRMADIDRSNNIKIIGK